MIDTGAGVIDADYRGIVFVLLYNHSDEDFPSKFRVLMGGVQHTDTRKSQTR